MRCVSVFDVITTFTAIYEIFMITYCSCIAEKESIPISVINECIPYLEVTDTSVKLGNVLIEIQTTVTEQNLDEFDYDCTWTVHRPDGRINTFDPYEDDNSWDFLMNRVRELSTDQLDIAVLRNMYNKLTQCVTDTALDEYWQWTFNDMIEYIKTHASAVLQ